MDETIIENFGQYTTNYTQDKRIWKLAQNLEPRLGRKNFPNCINLLTVLARWHDCNNCLSLIREFQKVWYEVLKREAKDYYDYEKKYGFAEYSAIDIFFEGIGILLKRKLIGIELVDDMFTTPVKWTWEKTKDITLEWRKVRKAPEIGEWLEYLYNEMQKREQRK